MLNNLLLAALGVLRFILIKQRTKRMVLSESLILTTFFFIFFGVAVGGGRKNVTKVGEAKLWDVANRQERFTLQVGTSNIDSIAYSPDGKGLATGTTGGKVYLWDPNTSQELATFQEHEICVSSLTFTIDGRSLVSSSQIDRTITLLDITMKTSRLFAKGWFGEIVISPDGKLLAASGLKDDTPEELDLFYRGKGIFIVKLWDLSTGKEKFSFHFPDTVPSMSFSADSKFLATGCRDGYVRVWDLENGKELVKLQGSAPVAYSPNGKLLTFQRRIMKSARSWEYHIIFSDAANQEERGFLRGNIDEIQCMAFSPDSKLLALGSLHEGITLWDVETRSTVANLTGHKVPVHSLAFSPDGKTLASAAYGELYESPGPSAIEKSLYMVANTVGDSVILQLMLCFFLVAIMFLLAWKIWRRFLYSLLKP